MREFEYFLFENFDADQAAQNPGNPRNFWGRETDAVLSFIARHPANICTYQDLCDRFGVQLVRKLIDGGIVRLSGAAVVFDCPVFLREDAAALFGGIAAESTALADLLEDGMAEIRTSCAQIRNGFSAERNLYHILCGMVFDGRFFDYLSSIGALAVSRQHPSGLDYLNVIYERCDKLQTLSDRLLCSYNRLVNDQCALQSFGDANGNRFDFYRFFRLMEREDIPPAFRDARAMLYENYGGADKDALLSDTAFLIQSGQHAPAAMELLELFGYMQNGKICVPVFKPEHQPHIAKIESIVERRLGKPIAGALAGLAGSIRITAVRHEVNRQEIANELYHIMFGFINEELTTRGIVAAPQQIPGEGRYFKCIEIYEQQTVF